MEKNLLLSLSLYSLPCPSSSFPTTKRISDLDTGGRRRGGKKRSKRRRRKNRRSTPSLSDSS
jgi:hypothetical protein